MIYLVASDREPTRSGRRGLIVRSRGSSCSCIQRQMWEGPGWGALPCGSPLPDRCPRGVSHPYGMGAGGVGCAGGWHLPCRSTQDTSALISRVAPAAALRGDTMLLGVRPWA